MPIEEPLLDVSDLLSQAVASFGSEQSKAWLTDAARLRLASTRISTKVSFDRGVFVTGLSLIGEGPSVDEAIDDYLVELDWYVEEYLTREAVRTASNRSQHAPQVLAAYVAMLDGNAKAWLLQSDRTSSQPLAKDR